MNSKRKNQKRRDRAMNKYWQWRIAIASVVLFVAVNASLIFAAPAQRSNGFPTKTNASPDGSSTPSKLAVLVGINEYGNPQQVSPLAGSINDVEDMLQVLTTKFEFPRENIRILT